MLVLVLLVFACHGGKECQRIYAFLCSLAAHQPLHIAFLCLFLVDIFGCIGHHQHDGDIRCVQYLANTPSRVTRYLSYQAKRAMRGFVVTTL